MVRKLVSAEAVEDVVYAAGATGYLVGFVVAVEVALSRLVY